MLTKVDIGELHLTPVRSTIQMRPALRYIDKIDEKFKAANKRIQDIEKDDAPAKKPAPSKAQALQVIEREWNGNLGSSSESHYDGFIYSRYP